MKLVLIAALTRSRVIGADGGMPWQSSLDLLRFRQLTLGSPIIMGRRTHESIGKVLDGRLNIVISTAMTATSSEHLRVVPSWPEALALAIAEVADSDNDRVFVIGGGLVYERALAAADSLELTIIERDYAGDTYFPPLNLLDWQQVNEVDHLDAYPPLRFCTYERASKLE